MIVVGRGHDRRHSWTTSVDNVGGWTDHERHAHEQSTNDHLYDGGHGGDDTMDVTAA